MIANGLSRDENLARLQTRRDPWDIVIIGGGATGVGIAIDAASRGLDVALIEQSDFGKGTSSRSTKLVHGGVRYLRQGDITLVRDALRERSLLKANAPHLVHDRSFLIPCRTRWERFYYGIGLKLYDLLASGDAFGRSRGVSQKEALRLVPQLRQDHATAGVVYHDGQFDDARLLINMVSTANEQGACILNYVAATGLMKDSQGSVIGVLARDEESSETMSLTARCVINAAGPFCDQVRRLDQQDAKAMLAASQGVHLVLPRRFLSGDSALIVPKTTDGRVLFLIPWHDCALVGTTDTPIDHVSLEPTATEQEIQFLLDTAAEYMSPAPTRSDVLSVFTGIRPLVQEDNSTKTASLSRDHVIRIAPSGLVTISGGKWTTVRKMAEDCVDRALDRFKMTAAPCRTQSLRYHGAVDAPLSNDPRNYYGSDLDAVQELERQKPELNKLLDDALSIRRSDVVWSVQNEMARTVDDVLARRTRSLLVNARASCRIAPAVARLIADQLDRDEAWQRDQVETFERIATHYLPPRSPQPQPTEKA